MEMPVILFDMDSKLAASRLSQELLSRLASVQEEQRRLEYYCIVKSSFFVTYIKSKINF